MNTPDSSSNLTTFTVSFISLFKIMNVVRPDQSMFLWMAASAAGTAAVNPNGIEILLANV